MCHKCHHTGWEDQVVPPGMDQWYKLLGVERGANESEIRRAYRRAALKYHPDKNSAPDAGKMFYQLGIALEAALAASATSLASAQGDYDEDEEKERLKTKLAKAEADYIARSRHPEPNAEVSPSILDKLRDENRERRREYDAKAHNQIATAQMRTARDKSGTEIVFPTVAEARRYVDANEGARLLASWHPIRYTEDYERETLVRFERRQSMYDKYN